MDRAFHKLKAILASAITIAHPCMDAKLFLTTDASNNADGAMLSQTYNDVTTPLQFFSKKLSSAQRKYSAFDRELLAVYEATKHFCVELESRDFY